MSTTFEIIDAEDIMVFVNTNTKDENAATNSKRESILSIIFYLDDDYFQDPQYGATWTEIRQKLRDTLTTLCEQPFSKIKMEQKGGMSYNYDFVVSFIGQNGEVVQTNKLEFKHNNTNVKDLVQFLELYDKDCKTKFSIFNTSYSEYYYDNYIDKYLALNSANVSVVKPDKDVYLKHVYDIKYKHPFFKHLYETKDTNKKEKDKVVEESRTTFINTYAEQFNFDLVCDKIKESQTNKIFMFWDKNNFHLQKLDVDKIKIVGIKPGSIKKLYFDVEVDNFMYNIRIRLNWGNNNGVANPRWKFSFIDK